MSLYTSTISMSYLYTDVHMQPWHLAQLWNLLAVGGTITAMAQNSNPQGRLDAGSPIPDILWLGNTKGSKDGWRIYIYYHLLYFVNPDAKNDIYYSWFCDSHFQVRSCCWHLKTSAETFQVESFCRTWFGLVDQCCLCSLTKQNAFAKVTTRQSLEKKSAPWRFGWKSPNTMEVSSNKWGKSPEKKGGYPLVN